MNLLIGCLIILPHPPPYSTLYLSFQASAVASSPSSSAWNDYSGFICTSFHRTNCLALLSIDHSYPIQLYRHVHKDKGGMYRGTVTSPKFWTKFAKLLQSLRSVTSNGATVFTAQHCYKTNYILFLLSIASVDTCKLIEFAKVSTCACLFALRLIISHIKLIWCPKICRWKLQWQFRRMWNSLSLLQLPSSRFTAVPETN